MLHFLFLPYHIPKFSHFLHRFHSSHQDISGLEYHLCTWNLLESHLPWCMSPPWGSKDQSLIIHLWKSYKPGLTLFQGCEYSVWMLLTFNNIIATYYALRPNNSMGNISKPVNDILIFCMDRIRLLEAKILLLCLHICYPENVEAARHNMSLR